MKQTRQNQRSLLLHSTGDALTIQTQTAAQTRK